MTWTGGLIGLGALAGYLAGGVTGALIGVAVSTILVLVILRKEEENEVDKI